MIEKSSDERPDQSSNEKPITHDRPGDFSRKEDVTTYFKPGPLPEKPQPAGGENDETKD